MGFLRCAVADVNLDLRHQLSRVIFSGYRQVERSWVVRARTKAMWGRMRDFVVYDVIHADDTPHRIALGVACGMFVCFTPTIPFQMVLAVALSWLLRANKVVGIPLVWLSNPATMVPIFLPQYLLGCQLLGMKAMDVDFSKLTQTYTDWDEQFLVAWGLMEKIFWPLWLGSIIISTLVGIASYYFSLFLIIRYRNRAINQRIKLQ